MDITVCRQQYFVYNINFALKNKVLPSLCPHAKTIQPRAIRDCLISRIKPQPFYKNHSYPPPPLYIPSLGPT